MSNRSSDRSRDGDANDSDAVREINITKYDVLGFDMDFTLARYELVPFFNVSRL